MNIKSLVKQVLIEKENKKYEKRLADSRVNYEDWLREQEKHWRSTDCEKTQETPMGFVLILATEGRVADYALENIKCYFDKNPDAFVIYGDEDVQESDGRVKNPWFKPDWSPDFLDSCLYFGSLLAVRTQYWKLLSENDDQVYRGLYGELFRKDTGEGIYRVTDLETYEKWLHDCVREGCQKGSCFVGHIPQILFHTGKQEVRAQFLRESVYLQARKQGMVSSFLETIAVRDHVSSPLVSVIIPSKDQPEILRQCITGIRIAAGKIPYEIILVDNGSKPENKAKVEELIRDFGRLPDRSGGVSVRYLYEPMEFHFSRMCNLGAEKANGKLLLFLNDDVELCESDSIAEMAARAVRDYTGAVGMKLLYPDSGLIQHAGITNLPMGPVHKLQFQTDDKDYYGKANHCNRNFLAVTAACLMVEAEKFREAGCFSEDLRVAFNDVELCFRLYELGYHNVCLNELHAYHHESLSRGADESPEKLARLLDERERLYKMHPGLEETDPYYSVYLNREGLDTRICPAYETSGNRFQVSGELLRPVDTEMYRQDDCLMFRVEDCRERKLVGYGVVLGDNNACYERTLLLDGGGDKGGKIYGIPLTGKYRPDLAENLPDQKNVALSGFMVKFQTGSVPEGGYRIGMMVRNRVTGGKLINWSNRMVQL